MTHAAIHGRNADGSYRVSIQGKPPVHLSEADAAALSGMSPEKLHSQAQAREKAQQAEADAPKDVNDPAAKTEETAGEEEETKVQGAARFDQVPNMDIWNDNPDGSVRSVDEAKKIFRDNIRDVEPTMADALDLLDVVEIKVVKANSMGSNWAQYRAKAVGSGIKGEFKWIDFTNGRNRITIEIDERVFASDQAVLGIISHELYELNAIRNVIEANPNRSIPGHILNRAINDFHSKAVELQNRAVNHMRTR